MTVNLPEYLNSKYYHTNNPKLLLLVLLSTTFISTVAYAAPAITNTGTASYQNRGSAVLNYEDKNESYSYTDYDQDGNPVPKLFNYDTVGKKSNAGPWLNITGSGFSNFSNSNSYTNADASVSGGYMFNNGGTLTLTNVVFSQNRVETTLTKTNDLTTTYGIVSAGGALYNDGRIQGDLTATFFGNGALSYANNISTTGNANAAAYGGAIYNNGTIDAIKSDFEGNVAAAHTEAVGGAIFNASYIGNIESNFFENTLISNYSAFGGAIYNSANTTIDSIKGSFISNRINMSTSADNVSLAFGAAIANYGKINSIDAVFDGNIITDSNLSAKASGGAIMNFSAGHLAEVSGVFVNNSIKTTNDLVTNPDTPPSGNAAGGAISNSGRIGNLSADFIANYVESNENFVSAQDTNQAYGGAIHNFNLMSNLELINGDFIGNYAKSVDAQGGAIYNDKSSVIKKIDGSSFFDNYTLSSSGQAFGGAIANYGTLDEVINANFVGNYAQTGSDANNALGGAIFNDGTFSAISGSFNHNYAEATNYAAKGGAIASQNGQINLISADFTGNYVQAKEASGGAIYNNAVIEKISGSSFVENYVQSSTGEGKGGAIYNDGVIDNLDADFSGNYSFSEKNSSGGAIYNNKTINSLTGSFSNNRAEATSTNNTYASGGAIHNAGTIDEINAEFNGNISIATDGSSGGAISNEGNIGSINGSFINNQLSGGATLAVGGAITNTGVIDSISGTFNNNVAKGKLYSFGGAIATITPGAGRIGEINGTFTNNSAEAETGQALGGAIVIFDQTSNISASFINNHAITSSSDHLALGGAIATYADLSLTADNAAFKFSGNYTEDKRGKIYNAIFVHTDDLTTPTKVTFNSTNGGSITFDDTISGGNINSLYEDIENIDYSYQYDIDITGDGTGNTQFNNDVENVRNFQVTNATVTFGSSAANGATTHGTLKSINNAPTSLILTGSHLNLAYDSFQNFKISNLSADENSFLSFSAAFEQGKSDTITITDNTVGSLKLKEIYLDGYIEVGNAIKLFDNKIMNISNADTFGLYKNNLQYHLSFDQTTGELKVVDRSVFAYPIIVDNGRTLYMQDMDVDNLSTAGIIDNSGITTLEQSKFTNNSNTNDGGVMMNKATGEMEIRNSEFNANHTTANGGAVVNYAGGKFETTNSSFTSNIAADNGGAMANYGKMIVNNSQFINNEAGNSGGAIFNDSGAEVYSNNTSFTGNVSAGNGGALANNGKAAIEAGKFENNNSTENGGAIANLSGGELNIANTSFSGNHAAGLGGAIYSNEDLSIVAQGQNIIFTGNTDSLGKNDIYMAQDKSLNLSNQGGNISFNSGINGDTNYNLNIEGTQEHSVSFNDADIVSANISVKNTNLVLKGESNINGGSLTLDNSLLDLANNRLKEVNLSSISGNSGSYIKIDVNPSTNSADVLNISGTISGKINLILDVSSQSKPTDSILFAKTPTYDPATMGGFEISRVLGNPYIWNSNFDDTAKEWYFDIGHDEQKGYEVVPEVIAYMGLHSAAIEQTRNMIKNISNKNASTKIKAARGYIYEDAYHKGPLANIWVEPTYHTATNKKPFNMDANIWGLEAGMDVQADIYNKVGAFISYRNGSYDFDGEGTDYFSKSSSEIDIDSTTAGLYYRYDRNKYWLFGTVYAGWQKADISGGEVSSDTDGMQWGLGAEFGKTITVHTSLTLEPSLGIFYTQVDFDDGEDKAGKTAEFDSLQHFEFEIGMKLEKIFYHDFGAVSKVYAKPSFIMTSTSGEVKISGMEKVSTYDDNPAGRIELGGRISLSDQLSAYGYANYTIGTDYNAASAGLGLNYAW